MIKVKKPLNLEKNQIRKLLNFENSNFLNSYILKYLKKLLNSDFKKKLHLYTTSLWDWYTNCQNGPKFEILSLYRINLKKKINNKLLTNLVQKLPNIWLIQKKLNWILKMSVLLKM